MVKNNWEYYKDWVYPYRNGKYRCLNDPKYIKDRNKTFAKHGNGWWWGNGWWNGKDDTVAKKQRAYRRKKEKRNDIRSKEIS